MSVKNPLTRNDVRNIWDDVFQATRYLTVFIEWQIDYFFNNCGYECTSDNDEVNKEGFNLELLILAHRITIFNHQIVEFLQNEHPQYQQRFIREVAPKQIEYLRDLMEKFDYQDIEFESVEKKIDYAWEISDGINSAAAALNGLLNILDNIEDLIEDSGDLERILDYQITFNDTLKDMGFKSSYFEEDDEEINHKIDTFTWNGTPSELALLFSTLVENGYIEPPLLTDGKVNKSGLSRKISSHFNLAKGSFKSVLNALGENTITPDNQFYKAMQRVPRNRKEA